MTEKELMNTETFSIPVRENVGLRFIRPDEAEALFALVDKNRAYLREWLDWVDAQTGPEVSRQNIQGRIERAEAGEALDLGIYQGDKLIGSMGFISIKKKSRRAEIGYWLAEDSGGGGIMTDCVRTLVSYGFKGLQLHRIEIHCSMKNEKSFAIPERLGFRLEGVLRDGSFLYDHFESSKVYSILDGEWRNAGKLTRTRKYKVSWKMLGVATTIFLTIFIPFLTQRPKIELGLSGSSSHQGDKLLGIGLNFSVTNIGESNALFSSHYDCITESGRIKGKNYSNIFLIPKDKSYDSISLQERAPSCVYTVRYSYETAVLRWLPIFLTECKFKLKNEIVVDGISCRKI